MKPVQLPPDGGFSVAACGEQRAVTFVLLIEDLI
ncbi:hypothetical protein MXAN_3794 [Myxococcus xanthus DK 1622]|uniref:Uncharacterized protein n=1 Tax=Myxococcus xanthus (strain DK1622) TaxID=246197 RepID=Q1D5U7_MYXXD|nr:hypothetical protein MXAN_3794 [Myxococcus xanthus DK 1622]